MTRPLAALLLTLVWLSITCRAAAQEPPPKIGPFAFDVQGTVPRFSKDDQLAQSRDLLTKELPVMTAVPNNPPPPLSALLSAKLVAVMMTQTANNQARADFETAVMQSIVGATSIQAGTN